MFEFLNWKDTSILWHYDWFWLLLALGLGIWVGYTTCIPTRSSEK
jgi:hypothetical protein